MKKYIISIFIILDIIGSISFAQEQNLFITKEFNVYPDVEDRISSSIKGPEQEHYNTLCDSNTPTADWISYFRSMGIKWPKDSSIRLDTLRWKFVVKNTQENMELLGRILGELGMIPSLIEIELYYVEFDKSDISKLILDHKLTKDNLKSLWKIGKGELLFAPRIITAYETEATIKNVPKVICPTKTKMDIAHHNSDTNVVDMSNLATSGVCMVFSVLPERDPDSTAIFLTLDINIIDRINSNTYRNSGKNREKEVKQCFLSPTFIHTQTIRTSIVIDDGEMILLGGGMPSANPGKIIYTFVTAQFVDMKGEPIKTVNTK